MSRNLQMTKLLTLLLVLNCVTRMNSFKIIQNDGIIHENEKSRHYLEQSEYKINKGNLKSLRNDEHIIEKRDTMSNNDPMLSKIIEVKNNVDTLDFIFPKDDFYGYQPQNVNYDIEYVTEKDKIVKINLKTRYEIDEDGKPSSTTKESWNPFFEVNFGSKWTTTTSTESPATTIESTETSTDMEITTGVIDLTLKPTILDESNDFGRKLKKNVTNNNDDAMKVNKMKKSSNDFARWSKLICEIRCLKSVPNYYNPVCGSDGMMYWNKYKLSCMNKCGRSIDQVPHGYCRGSNFRIIV